ncbi:MAG TPA: VacJ family lipoprotein [Burkholderiales bacterium]
MEYHQAQACIISKNKNAIIAVLAAALLLSSGCASTPKEENQVYDPYEGVNRKIYKFNDALDRAVVKPIADTYVKVTPEAARTSVSNFFDNLGYLNTILNDFFQGKVKQGTADLGRFLINSTIGSLGLVDVASKMGLKAHEEDVGQTLGVYGAPEGAYLMVPLLGPNTVRDSPDLVVSTVTSGLFYISQLAVTLPLGALMVIDKRARASSYLKIIDEAALDRYVFIRDAYLQHRNFLIYDGNPPPRKFEDDGSDETPAQTPKSEDEKSEEPAQTSL